MGYYVNSEYDSPELNENPPELPMYERIQRNILADKPRVRSGRSRSRLAVGVSFPCTRGGRRTGGRLWWEVKSSRSGVAQPLALLLVASSSRARALRVAGDALSDRLDEGV